MSDKPCIFCAIIQGTVPSVKILEKDNLIVIQDIAPKAPIHYLIIPKEHLVTLHDIEDDRLKISLLDAAQELGKKYAQTSGFNMLMNNGAAAGQVVEHAHIHFLAGKKLQFLVDSQPMTL